MKLINQENKIYSVLIVEDEAIIAMDLSSQLEGMGYQICAVADNGEDAIKMAKQHHPDLILMDVVIKGAIDGIQTAEKIIKELKIPIIYLTSFSDEDTVRRASKTMPYGYISKPFYSKDLNSAIKIAIYKATLEKNLRSSELWFSATLSCVSDAVIATNTDYKVHFINPAAELLIEATLEEVEGLHINDVFMIEDDINGSKFELSSALQDNKVTDISFGSTLHTLKGNRRPVDFAAAPIREDGKPLGSVIAMRDVSKRIASEVALKNSQERFRMAFENAPVGMALISLEGFYLQTNHAMSDILGLVTGDLNGAFDKDYTYADDVEMERENLRKLISNETVSVQFEKRYVNSGGEIVWTLVSVSLLQQEGDPFCYLYQVHNYTDHKAAETHLNFLAHHDTLTGLLNRTKFMIEVKKYLAYAQDNNENFAIMFIDLDHFKDINDSLGHDVGDKLLVDVAGKLKESIRDVDLIARLGGDEFTIMLRDVNVEDMVHVVADKIQSNLFIPLNIENNSISCQCSIGVSLFPKDGNDVKSLLKNADNALYLAKRKGRNNVRFYHPGLGYELTKKLRLDKDLRTAIAETQFELYYQPIVSNRTDGQFACEALVRWNHPSRGLIMPAEFISAAEESGLIVEIGAWVLETACFQAANWQKSMGDMQVSVNVSPKQFFSGDIYRTIKNALERSKLNPHLLTVEVTEELFLKNTTVNLDLINKIKEMGVKISIDDFGIGYSSLRYIKLFGPHKIKIDRSFIRDIDTNPESNAIVNAIIAMGKALNIELVAEGVESLEINTMLQSLSCDSVQGYFYSKPLPLRDFEDWFNQFKN